MAFFRSNNNNERTLKQHIIIQADNAISSNLVIVNQNTFYLEGKYKTLSFDYITSNVTGQDYVIIARKKTDGTNLQGLYYRSVNSLQTIDVTDVAQCTIYLYGKNTGQSWTVLARINNVLFQ